MAHVLREQWDISYLHSYGRLGSALVDRLASRSSELAGTVIAFATLKPTHGRRGWSVVACIELGQWGTIFGRVAMDVPWTSRSIRSQMRIGQRVVPVPIGPDVRSVADIVFVPIN